MSLLKVILYVLIVYTVISITIQAITAHHVQKTYKIHSEQHEKWSQWFKQQDSLGWASKQGYKQEHAAAAEHEREATTGRYAYS